MSDDELMVKLPLICLKCEAEFEDWGQSSDAVYPTYCRDCAAGMDTYEMTRLRLDAMIDSFLDDRP